MKRISVGVGVRVGAGFGPPSRRAWPSLLRPGGGMRFTLSSCVAWSRRLARTAWRGLRELSGDAAYERYLRCAVKSGTPRPLSAAEFYLDQLNRRYSRVSRCC